jgi:phosphate:Na+ symporter
MADVVEAMLEGSRELLRRDDLRLAGELRRMDDVLDRLHVAIKRFLGGLGRQELTDTERNRLAQVLAAARNFEHAGDIIDQGLLNLAGKRIRRRLRFTDQELVEAEVMHEHLLAQLRLAAAVLVHEDLRAARLLVEEKERFRDLERAAAESDFARLHDARLRPETSGLHLDAVRDLKRVDAHLAAIAHPLLERSHLLRPSRLVRPLAPAGPVQPG